MTLSLRVLAMLSIAVAGPQLGRAQVPDNAQAFRARVKVLIAHLSSRPLTSGDTFLTWAPDVRLIHTARVHGAGVQSSLLRGDGMIGTAETHWSGQTLESFDVRWTVPDSTGHRGVDSTTAIEGRRSGRRRLPTNRLDA
jgi:hypothetical protein